MNGLPPTAPSDPNAKKRKGANETLYKLWFDAWYSRNASAVVPAVSDEVYAESNSTRSRQVESGPYSIASDRLRARPGAEILESHHMLHPLCDVQQMLKFLLVHQ